MYISVLLYVLAFIAVWFGAGLIVSSTDRFSRKLRFSSFAISFVLLGLLTSSPELAVGLNAVVDNDPEVFIGNLLGGIPSIFLFIIPLLAIFGNGINLKHELNTKVLLLTLGVIMAPSILILDKRITTVEGVVLILLYVVMLFFFERQFGLFEKNTKILNTRAYSFLDLIKLLIGIGIVAISSNIIVEKTVYFSELFHISAFYISLIVLSLGTNLPELSLAIRSVVTGEKDVALGDYLGSAAVNTLLFGVLTLLHGGEVLTVNDFFGTYIFITLGLYLFFVYSRLGNRITRLQGIIMFMLYIAFVMYELW